MDIVTADSDWISIIIFILATAASIMKSVSRKKKVAQPTSTTEDEFPWSEEEVDDEEIETFDSLFPIEEKQQNKQPQTDVSTLESYTHTTPADIQVAAIDSVNEEEGAVKEERHNKKSVKQEERQTDSKSIEFDLRQAVISNIILKRPDF